MFKTIAAATVLLTSTASNAATGLVSLAPGTEAEGNTGLTLQESK